MGWWSDFIIAFLSALIKWRSKNVQMMVEWKFGKCQMNLDSIKMLYSDKPPDRQIGWWKFLYADGREIHLHWNGLSFDDNTFYVFQKCWVTHTYDPTWIKMTLVAPDEYWDKDKLWIYNVYEKPKIGHMCPVESKVKWDSQNNKWVVEIIRGNKSWVGGVLTKMGEESTGAAEETLV